MNQLTSRLKDKYVYSLFGTTKNILTENSKRVCTAVHPDYPDKLNDGRSRGRKIHLDSGDEIHTACNMLVDVYIPNEKDMQPCTVDNGKCKVCFGVDG